MKHAISKRQRRAAGAACRREAAAFMYDPTREGWVTPKEFCDGQPSCVCGSAVYLDGTGEYDDLGNEILDEVRISYEVGADGSATKTILRNGITEEVVTFPRGEWRPDRWSFWPSNFGGRRGVSIEARPQT